MEKITIKNFLIFDDLEMEINRLNILIGEQASGKSLLAKLIYFFRKLSAFIPSSLLNGDDFASFKIHQVNLFLNIFPPQFWNLKKNFKITYNYSDDVSVSITSDFNHPLLIDIKYSAELQNQYLDTLKNFQEKQTSKRNSGLLTNNDVNYLLMEANQEFTNNGFGEFIKSSSYVPAGRGFFSILENNSFALLGRGLALDPLMQDFGTFFQEAKRFNIENIFSDNMQSNKNDILQFYEKVLKGRYEIIDNTDFLISKDTKVAVSRASSGQQEAFPLVLILGMLLGKNIRRTIHYLFIEEPEAHLFPYTQNLIISAILNGIHISNEEFIKEHGNSINLFITTHSPYILSSINNAILADDLVQKGKLTVEEYVEMSDGSYPISLDDISAYSMDAGQITNIKDESYRMIGGEILDSVSNHFGEVMDKLMALDD